MKESLVSSAELSNLFHGLNNANLVVDCHDTDKRCVWAKGGLQNFEIDKARVGYRQIGYLESFILQVPAAIEHTFMLRLSGNDMLLFATAAKEPGNAFDAHVVTFRCPTGEDDLFGICADQVCNVSPRLIRGLLRLPPIGMRARVGVAVQACHER